MVNPPQLLTVRILSQKEILFSDKAKSVSSTNSSGKFDVLPLHANFITFIENSPIIIETKTGEIQRFNFPSAIMYVSSDTVDIYTEMEQKSE